MTKPFWQYKTENRPHEIAFYWVETHLAQKALETGTTDYEYGMQGTLVRGKLDEMLAEVEALGVKLFYHKISSPLNRDDYFCFVSEETAVWVDITKRSGGIIFSAHTLDPSKLPAIKEICTKYISRNVKKGSVYALLAGQNGPQLRSFGVAGENFIASNYRPEVVTEYRHIVDDLNSDDPCGRIIILDGQPGTGKTHMVRALLNEVPKATFVLIQSSMIASLGAPDFLTALMREQRKGHPMILILEDADEALSSRKADNISAISALLNFSDGIFGALMDMRIVATTNIELGDLDKAVMRDGRLCRRVEVGQLDHVQAEEVYFRIAGKPSEGKFTAGNFYPLGTVYKAAKGGTSGSFEVKRAKGRIGFFADEEEPTISGVESSGEAVTRVCKTATDLERLLDLPKGTFTNDDSDLIDEDLDDDDDDDWDLPGGFEETPEDDED